MSSSAPRIIDPGVTSARVLTVLVGNIFPPAVAILSAPILAQSLGVSGRGEVAAATAPFLLMTAVATIGIPEAAAYFVAMFPRLSRSILSKSCALLSGAGLVATMGVVAFAARMSVEESQAFRLTIIATCAIVPNLLVGAFRGVASGLHQWQLVTKERAIGALSRIALLLPLWLTGELTPTTAVLILVVTPAVGGIAYLRLLRRRAEVDTRDLARGISAQRMLSYGWRVWAGSVSGVILMRIDQVLVAPLSSAESLGLYVVAVSISEVPLVFNSAVRDVSFVSEAMSSDSSRLCASARVSTILCGLVAAGIGLTMYIWVTPVFGRDFSAAVSITQVLLVAVVAGTPGSIAGSMLGGRGRPGLRSWSLAVACAVNVILIVLLVPRLGAMGAAIATLVGNLAASNLNIVFVRIHFGVSIGDFYGIRRSDLSSMRAAATRVGGQLRGRT